MNHPASSAPAKASSKRRETPLGSLTPGSTPLRVSASPRLRVSAIAALLLGTGFGCAVSVNTDIKPHAAYPGTSAAIISEARAQDSQAMIIRFMSERASLEHRRDAFLADAVHYRDKSAAAWNDPALPRRARGPAAGQYDNSASDAETAAWRLQTRIDSFSAQIALLEMKSAEELYQMREYKTLIAPLED